MHVLSLHDSDQSVRACACPSVRHAYRYNKVTDNQESDWDVCTAATASAAGTLQITAPHGYGTLDLGYTAFDAWVTFQLKNIETWSVLYSPPLIYCVLELHCCWCAVSVRPSVRPHVSVACDTRQGDPTQRHLKFARMCPTDICSTSPGVYDVPGVGGRAIDGPPRHSTPLSIRAQFDLAFRTNCWYAEMRILVLVEECPSVLCLVSSYLYCNKHWYAGLFQGFRGAEGEYPDSTGFLTISSDWQVREPRHLHSEWTYVPE